MVGGRSNGEIIRVKEWNAERSVDVFVSVFEKLLF